MPTDDLPRPQSHRETTAGSVAELPRRFAALVGQARALEAGRPVLVSASEPAPGLDPLAALDAGARAAEGDPALAALLDGGRMFWAHAGDDVALAGLGAAATIAPSGDARFRVADAEWRALLRDALVEPEQAGVSGPILMGGFSFEPAGPRTALWDGFASTLLVAPALHVSLDGGAARLTLTTVVHPDGGTSVDVPTLLRLRDVVRQAPPLPRVAPHEPSPLAEREAIPAREWRAVVDDAVAEIRAGALEKVVLARAVHAALPGPLSPIALLDHLRQAHREGYVFATWRGARVFAGASPERLVRLVGDRVDASSLAGSTRRGETRDEDDALARALVTSPKDLAEHAMVRSALTAALGHLCDDVRSNDAPSLLSLPNVHHLHTAVRARLRAGHSLLDLVGALHPTPAVGGTPRAEALRFIVEHERMDRGWYAAPIGWIGRDAGELAVALRSALLAGDEATLFAGCGIVAGSDAERELAESRVKLRAMEAALAATVEPAAALVRGDDA